MLLAYAGTYAYFAERLATISALLRSSSEETVGTAYADLRTLLPVIASDCETLGCTSTQAQAGRIMAWLDENTVEPVPRAVEDLSLRLADDLKNRWFLHIHPDFVTLYDNSEPFGPLVNTQFPSATFDIGEAAKCLAVGRGTACVFHLMRASEVGIKATLHVLGITRVDSNWGAYIKAINDAIKGHPEEPFFRAIAGDLQSIKLVWRNPSMHVERTFTTEQAYDIYRGVRAFMATLATKVGEI